ILSDGVDTTSATSLGSAIEAAQAADTLIYCLGFYQPGAYGGLNKERRKSGEKVLRALSRQTGGSYYEVRSKDQAEQAFQQIEEELRNQYNLGYKSDG